MQTSKFVAKTVTINPYLMSWSVFFTRAPNKIIAMQGKVHEMEKLQVSVELSRLQVRSTRRLLYMC